MNSSLAEHTEVIGFPLFLRAVTADLIVLTSSWIVVTEKAAQICCYFFRIMKKIEMWRNLQFVFSRTVSRVLMAAMPFDMFLSSSMICKKCLIMACSFIFLFTKFCFENYKIILVTECDTRGL